MVYYALKVLISAVFIVLISEVGRRSSLFGVVLAPIPAVSVLACIWMYIETNRSRGVTCEGREKRVEAAKRYGLRRTKA